MKFTKTRIAPTPSGYLHLGNAMSFLITAALAKQKGAKILLRIDDLDKERVKKKYVEDVFSTLSFLGIPWDEGPRNYKEYKAKFSQVHRLAHYKKALEQLKNDKSLFACNCSRRKIDRESPDGSYPGTCRTKAVPFEENDVSWRLATTEKELKIKDIFGKESSSTISPILRDFVVRRKDGLPSFQLTSAVDDQIDQVDFIVRGNDLWGSTLAQVYLSKKLAGSPLKNTVYYHHALMVDDKNRKMSKSSGATSLQSLIRNGMEKEDIYATICGFLKMQPVADFDEFQKAFRINVKKPNKQ